MNQELVNYLAAKLYLANQCEVELARMAEQEANHPEVKQFAKKLQQDHQKAVDQLQQAMPNLKSIQSLSFAKHPMNSMTSPNTRNFNAPNNVRNNASNQSGTIATRSQQGEFLDGAAKRLIDIERRAIENNYKATEDMLSQKSGEEFDMCFVAQQIGVYTWMHSELKAIQDVGPADFTEIVQKCEQTVKQHLSQAKNLAEKLESQSDNI